MAFKLNFLYFSFYKKGDGLKRPEVYFSKVPIPACPRKVFLFCRVLNYDHDFNRTKIETKTVFTEPRKG